MSKESKVNINLYCFIQGIEYECLRCGEIFESGWEGRIDTGWEPRSYGESSHRCHDGGFGIGRCIGFSPSKPALFSSEYKILDFIEIEPMPFPSPTEAYRRKYESKHRSMRI